VRFTTLCGLALLFPGGGRPLVTGEASAQPPGLKVQAPVANPADIAKGSIEGSTKTLVASRSVAALSANSFVNPKVEPGRVHWHATFPAACEAARKSGKPVLLFQMMGKLDEQFC
jgi:hypothetical protein